jgi:hypothetical protein
MKNKLCYIFAHVDAALDPLHCHSYYMSHSPSTSLFFVFWIAPNLQDHCFAVIGQTLGTLHLLECEGVEFELGIRTETKRCKESEAR